MVQAQKDIADDGALKAEAWVKDSNPLADVVPMRLWGKDHWSTLGYVECRCVDHGGKLHPQQMRCDPRLHRHYAHLENGGGYPTRLAGGVELFKHDDWSCVEDMIAFRLVRIKQEFAKPTTLSGMRAHFLASAGLRTAVLELTPLGVKVAAALRAHKAAGGSFGNFRCPGELLTEATTAD